MEGNNRPKDRRDTAKYVKEGQLTPLYQLPNGLLNLPSYQHLLNRQHFSGPSYSSESSLSGSEFS